MESADREVDQALFLKNMAALWRVDPELAMRIDAVADEDRLETVPTRSGHCTAAAQTPAGKRILLHSRHDPVVEAERLVGAVRADECFCFLVSGSGLGYHLRALDKRFRCDPLIVVTEPSLPVLATSLANVDLADLIRARRLVFLTRADKADVHARLHPHASLLMIGMTLLAHPPSQQLAGDFHRQMHRLILDFVAYTRMSLVSLVANAEITCRNIAYNLPAYVSTPPIDVLKGRFAGCPGIVVSAGPSLRRNVHLLKEAQGHAVLCTAQTTFKPLLEQGIVPDFVTSLDFHEVSRQFFDDIEDFRDVHLVAEPKATWHVIDRYGGPVSLLHNPFAEMLIGRELAARDGLPAGATVAHLAFYLAQYLGCDPIIFVGQDLAFTNHVFYVPGVAIHRVWRGECNRFNTMETKEWERIVRNRPILRTIEDIDGRKVFTDDLLFTYLEQFEKDFIHCPARLIDATQGGARLRGTEVMSLRTALDRFCAGRIDERRYAYRAEAARRDPEKCAAARREVAARRKEVEEVRRKCAAMVKLLVELQELADDPARFNRKLVRVDELRAAVRRSDRAYGIINQAAQLTELRRFAADKRLDASGDTGAARAQRQLTRDLEFVRGMQSGAERMLGILDETLDRFDALGEEGGA